MTPARRSKGFRRTADLVERSVKAATGARGFAQARLLTHWAEIAGADVAAISRPVEVKYARGGFGATLVLLTTGANAPVLKMQEPQIRDRVNATYGYNAIARIRITQTAATGFAEGQVAFDAKPAPTRPAPSGVAHEKAAQAAQDVKDSKLRDALSRLGAHIVTKQTTK